MKYTKEQLIKRGFSEASISTRRCPHCGEHLIGQRGGHLVCVNCARSYKTSDIFSKR